MNSVDASVSFPHTSSSGSNENPATEMVNVERMQKEIEPLAQEAHHMFSDLDASQELGRMMKIAPAVDVSVIMLSFFVPVGM